MRISDWSSDVCSSDLKVSPAWFPPIAAAGSWMHVKLLLVAVIFAFYITTGRMLKASAVRGSLPSGGVLRWYNEIPLLLVVPIIYLVLAKPFCRVTKASA